MAHTSKSQVKIIETGLVCFTPVSQEQGPEDTEGIGSLDSLNWKTTFTGTVKLNEEDHKVVILI